MSGLNVTELEARLSFLEAQVELSRNASEQNALDVQIVFIIAAAVGIMSMQSGFAMLECGQARAKSTQSILMKNLLDFTLGAVVFYMLGWGLYVGDNPFVSGAPYDFFTTEVSTMATFVQQFGFAVTGSTILSGAVLGRMRLGTYIYLSLAFTGVIYPVAAHWAWSENGWLGNFGNVGYRDLAGSGVVHMLGGVFALVGCILVGPRVGRFVEDNEFLEQRKIVRDLPGHSATIQVLGVFMLTVGWFYFNAGSATDMDTAQRALINTLLASSASATIVFMITTFYFKVHKLKEAGNAVLAGLVAITAGCGYVETWAALIIGAAGGTVYILVSYLLLYKLFLDDPLDAFAVHGAAGFVGVILVGFFDLEFGLMYTGNFDLLFAQLIGAGALITWGLVCAIILMGPMYKWIALDEDDQLLGLDIKYHAGYAYPEFGVHDVEEYNKMKLAALRKMRPPTVYGSEYGSEASEHGGNSYSSYGSGNNNARAKGSGRAKSFRASFSRKLSNYKDDSSKNLPNHDDDDDQYDKESESEEV